MFKDCGNNACVKIDEDGRGGFVLTSTLGEDKGAVTYTATELATFLSDVKAGRWDNLHADAREAEAPVPA